MKANVHAILLLAMITGTLVILLTCRRRKFTAYNLAAPVLGIGCLFLLFLALSAHKCNSGNPFHQLVIGGACFIPISLFVDRKVLRRSVIAVILVLFTLLFNHFNELVHTPHYTGNPKEVRRMMELDQQRHTDQMRKVVVKRTWHSWLTGLYETQDLGLSPTTTPSKTISTNVQTDAQFIEYLLHENYAEAISQKVPLVIERELGNWWSTFNPVITTNWPEYYLRGTYLGRTNTANWHAHSSLITTNVQDFYFESTNTAECSAFMITLAESKDKKLGEAARDFCEKNKKPHTLDLIGRLNIKHVVWSNELHKAIFDGHEDGWEAFYKRYPDSPGITYLSRPGFSKDGSIAIIHMGNQRGGCAGEHRICVFERKGKKWIETERFQSVFGRGWMS